MTSVHVVVPDSIDDPGRPSGGNAYDRRICQGLSGLGWTVREHPAPGLWPWADAPARMSLQRVIEGIPDGAVVLIDGLIASAVPEVLVPHAPRLRLVVLVHMPLGDAKPGDEVAVGERAVLSAATAVVTTSSWTRNRLIDQYALAPGQLYVAEPGVDAAGLAPGTPTGGELLCVAAVTHNKGHDVLLTALAKVADLPWRCVCVGDLTRDPDFVDHLGHQARESGIQQRVQFTGPHAGAGLEAAFAAADLLVLASRAETYGMVVAEALARGIPVIASAVGGLPQTLGRAADGSRPGLLVPPDDPAALAAALRSWFSDGELRRNLRSAARDRRTTLSGWSTTSARIALVLGHAAEVAA